MSELFSAFGIDWRLLLVNMVNFGLLLLGLWYFLYGPLMRLLDERRARVAQSMEDAEVAARARQEIEGARSDILAAAGKEADDVLSNARASGTAREREIVERAEQSAAALLAQAEAQAKELQAEAMEKSKQEVAKLIVLGMEGQILSRK